MIGYYTAPFRTAHPLHAVEYLTLIAMNADLPGAAGKQQAGLCYEALRELVLETNEYAALIGDVANNGERVDGAIQNRMELLHLEDEEEFLRTITLQAASMAEESGRITDAVLLYHLANQYDAVISIVNRALSESIAIELGNEPMRLEPLKPAAKPQVDKQGQLRQTVTLSLTSIDDPVQLAQTMNHLYNNDVHKYEQIKAVNRDSCGLLIRISDAKHLIEQGKWKEGCDKVSQLTLLPLDITSRDATPALPSTAVVRAGDSQQSSSNIPWIRDRASLLSSLPPSVAHVVPALLIMTLTALSRWRAQEQSSAFVEDNATRQATIKRLGDSARDLMVYAGLVRYKLPGRVFEKLGEVVGEEGG